MPKVTKADLRHILDMIETVEAEYEQLELDNDWFVSDAADLIQSAKQLVLERLSEEEE